MIDELLRQMADEFFQMEHLARNQKDSSLGDDFRALAERTCTIMAVRTAAKAGTTACLYASATPQ